MDIHKFIEDWKPSGGSEASNAQPFIDRLCAVLDLPQPAPARSANDLNDYVYERRVDFKHPNGTVSPGRIDCYKRDCFILEAKQSSKRQLKNKPEDQLDLLPEDALQRRRGHAVRGTGRWDSVMVAAKKQAEDYAKALPVEHGYPPFLLIVDVGYVIEVYADFSGLGKNYAPFPDKRSFRVSMDDLAEPDVQGRLRSIWTDPLSLNPAQKSAEVTQDIAARLAKIAKSLEKREEPKDVAEFLMRCLFTMFAEDVGLLPRDCFVDLLEQLKGKSENFPLMVGQFWEIMDKGGPAIHLNTMIKRFNGSLFKSWAALKLEADEISELWLAAKRDWQHVEPAIFGTLLEQALEERERSELGAHYTPRAYVERLVIPTIIEPLRDDWAEVKDRIEDLRKQGEMKKALETAQAFHRKLCSTRVLDPACGTGNFLYVSLELMKQLEGEVLEAISDLGGEPSKYADFPKEAGEGLVGQRLVRTGGRFTVDPHQFYGLEKNERAVPIADLVLWIGYLKWQLKNGQDITEPVLHAYGTIRAQDAILDWRERKLRRDEKGRPITIWDGRTKKPHPITGEMVPDENARIETYTYTNPHPADWPLANFIVGNPPFIAGKDMRAELGDGYAEACWQARPKMPGGADFVMHFWDQAAGILLAKGTHLRRFGFITTNSVTQTFSRRVIERHMNARTPLSLVYAVPDHPWLKQTGKAAVRIAMTVAEKGYKEGVLASVVSESGLNSDAPNVELEAKRGRVLSNFTLGADLTKTKPLWSNEGLSSRGVSLHGSGFIVSPREATALGLGKTQNLDKYIFDYRNGRDIAQRPRGVMIIDLYPLEEKEVRDRFSRVYQYLATNVKPERDQNKRAAYRKKWWLFGEPRGDLRPALMSLDRYVTTIETAKHRFFQFLDANIRPDNKLLNICLDQASFLSLLSSRVHTAWAMTAGGWLGVGNDSVYVKTRTFDPFPFPLIDEGKALQQLTELGERLDAFRKKRLAERDFLTMTALYNVLERVRELENGCDVPALDEKEKDIYDVGLVGVLKDIHDRIDQAAFAAYGWADLAAALVGKPGGTTPSEHKSSEQEEAEQELLQRLVELNQERAAEEARGVVHWLRPDYQIPKLRHKLPQLKEEAEAPELAYAADEKKPKWPKDGLDQIRVVRDVLAEADAPLPASTVMGAFGGRVTQKRRERIQEVLDTLVSTGSARTGVAQPEDQTVYFLPN